MPDAADLLNRDSHPQRMRRTFGVATALQTLEALRLANQLYESELLNRLIVELAPLGKIEEYVEKRGTDAGGDFIVEVLGKKKALQILQE